jgi:hypothetical protein
MLINTDNTLNAKWATMGDWSPLAALKRTSETKWLIDGVIPSGSINWMVAAPSSFKTFLALDMAACIASGRTWHGRETDQSVVLYVAGEGDDDIHVRRAAAEMAAGDSGPLRLIQLRPRLDEPHGLASLLALVQGVTDGWQFSEKGLAFPELAAHSEVAFHGKGYLTPDEQAAYDAHQVDDYSESPSGKRAREAHLALIKPLGYDQDNYAFDRDACRALRSRFNAWDEAMAQVDDMDGLQFPGGLDDRMSKNVFLVIDTYSQTSADDAKGTVSRYIKTLRDLQEKAAALGGVVTVLVVDHTTKSGDSYMGSLAKLGDSDTMIEVDRHGTDNAVTLKSLKMRSGANFEPIHLNLVPFTLEGFTDAQDRPLMSLVVSDGEQAHRIRKAAGAAGDTAAALVLTVLTGAGECNKADLRQRYSEHPTNKGKSEETVKRAFNRALLHLTESDIVLVSSDGFFTQASGVDL